MSEITKEKLCAIVEAAIFASHKPMSANAIQKILHEENIAIGQIREAIESLQEHYQTRGVILQEVASGYRFQVGFQVAEYIGYMFEEKPSRYSRALMETLALIAYRQPITRGEIEEIRGVQVTTQTVKTLHEHDWIKVVGHKDVPGKPGLYATTKFFLDHFNLKSLEDLPPLSEIKDMLENKIEEDTSSIEQEAETSVEQKAETSVEQEAEASVEQEAGASIEQEAEASVEQETETSVEQEAEASIEQEADDFLEQEVESNASQTESLGNELDENSIEIQDINEPTSQGREEMTEVVMSITLEDDATSNER